MWTLPGTVVTAAVLTVAHCVPALAWTPQRNVELVVPSGPGASLDQNVRLIHRLWNDMRLLPVPSAVVNRTGGEHVVAYNYVAQRTGDPHVLALATSVLLTAHISGRTSISHADVTPVALLLTEWSLTLVRADSPLKTGRDLIEALKRDPASLSLAYGSTTHRVASALPMQAAGVSVKDVRMPVFEGGKTAVMVLGGHADVLLTSVVQVMPHVESGKLRVIAVNSPKRLDGPLAAAPTWSELGYKSGAGSWRSIIAPRGISPEQVAYWEASLRKAVESEEFRRDAQKYHWEVTFRGAADTRAFMDAEYKELAGVMGYLGLVKK